MGVGPRVRWQPPVVLHLACRGDAPHLADPRILSLVLPTSLGHIHPSPHVSLSNPSLLLELHIDPQLCLIAIYAHGYRTTGIMPILLVDLQRCLCEPVGALLYAPSGVGGFPMPVMYAPELLGVS